MDNDRSAKFRLGGKVLGGGVVSPLEKDETDGEMVWTRGDGMARDTGGVRAVPR